MLHIGKVCLGLSWSTLLGIIAYANTAMCSTSAEVDLTQYSIEELTEMEVTTVSKYAQTRANAPSAVTVITADDIRAQGYRTLADILRAVPGLYVSYDRNYSYVGARGFSRPGDYNTRLLLLVDGYRVNDNTYDGANVGSEFLLAVDLIERVEFAPGPGSSIYGGNALFGVINVITKSGRTSPGANVTLSAGSEGQKRGAVRFGRSGAGSQSEIEAIVAGSVWSSDGDDLYFPEFDDSASNNGIAQDRDADGGEQVYAKLSYQSVVLSGAFSRRTKQIPTASFYQIFNQAESQTRDEQAFVHLAFDHVVRPSTKLHASAYYGRYDYEGHYTYDHGLNFDLGRGRWWGGELRFVLQPWDRHKVLLGMEYRDDPHRDQKNMTPDPYLLVLDDARQKTSYAGYIQDEWSITPHTTANIGVRHDGSDEDIRATSPRLAIIHRFGSNTTGKFLYGTAFRPPNAYEKYYVADAGTYKANLNLRHEKIKTMEWILDRAVGIRSRLTASFFTYRIENLIALTVDPTDSFFVFENVDRARARGLQLEWEYGLKAETRLRASTTWQRAEDELTNQPLDNSPRRLAKASMVWPFGPIWRGGFEIQHVAERATPFDGEVPDYTLANFTVHSRQLWERAEIRWSIYNLADVAYFDSPSEEHVDSLGRNLTEIRQDGRSYLASVVLTF